MTCLQQFLHVVKIWILKPHVVNQRTFGSKIISGDLDKEEFEVIRLIIPKSKDSAEPVRETIISCGSCVTFKGEDISYSISLIDLDIEIIVEDGGLQKLLTKSWLEHDLCAKLNHWFNQSSSGGNKMPMSLALIDIERYQRHYERMKGLYGKVLVESWPERTDPEKFVYEDIAIASYLTTLWEEDKGRIDFVDVGCGNGLLVYLLVMEGFAGEGIDIRKRGIWDTYPEKVRSCLHEKTITPSDAQLFPQSTWLIGNHSDELTPWLPIMAAKSSIHTNVFLLPCCPHDLHGRFAGGRSNSKSRYRTYLDYVASITKVCGFEPEEDALRIPSTKRVCIVGRQRSYSQDDRQSTLKQIDDFIRSKSAQDETKESNASEAAYDPSFRPRASVEPVRNCANVEASVRDHVCSSVFEKLLQTSNTLTAADGRLWNRGGSLTLSEVSQMFTPDILKKLKSEDGGLQTLLRNHHVAFQVVKGVVQVRLDESKLSGDVQEPPRKRSRPDVDKRKTKVCWMLQHHPQGCPYAPEQCNFAHGQSELVSSKGLDAL